MKIITLTLNPAFDVHCFAENFKPYHENLAFILSNEAGGKGVNISRALTANGVENLAFVVIGEENGDPFCRALDADNMTYRTLAVKGRIRENITLHTNDADETRISFSGFSADSSLLSSLEKSLADVLEEGSLVSLTGRLPEGLPMAAVKDFLHRLTEKGARFVIDSRSFTLADLLEIKPYLIKPNEEEISEYLGRHISSFDEALEAACELHRSGIENVMISLGAKGALLVSGEGAFVAEPPPVKVLSTVGAGDSSLAGFLAAAAKGESIDACLRLAMSFGSAACMSEGTRPPLKKDVESNRERILLRKIG